MSVAICGYVLGGGESSRMQSAALPQDKAMLRLGGETLLQRAVKKVQAVCGDAAVLCGPPERCSRFHPSLRAVPDLVPGCGPLGGLQAALHDAAEEWLLVVPVDLPLLPTHALRALVEWGTAGEPNVTCVEAEGFVQPLPAVLPRSALLTMDEALLSGERKLLPVLRRASQAIGSPGLRVLALSEIAPAEETTHWFLNANTPGDYRQICEICGEGNGLPEGASE